MNGANDPHTDNPAWYRNTWPWLLMLPPLASVFGGFTMLYLAVSEPNALVVEDYARIEELTAQRFARDRLAVSLDVEANLQIIENSQDSISIVAEITQLAGTSLPPVLMLEMRHAANASRDRNIEMTLQGGQYRADMLAVSGHYSIELSPPGGASWRLAGNLTPDIKTLRLQPFNHPR